MLKIRARNLLGSASWKRC